MISIERATQLADARRRLRIDWEPVAGDRFVMPNTEVDGVFVVAEMTIEIAELASGRLIRFNGTTEWALDSIPASEVLWLPRESQLRASLGAAFARLERLPDAPGGWAVVLTDGSRHVDVDAEDAYARALASRRSG